MTVLADTDGYFHVVGNGSFTLAECPDRASAEAVAAMLRAVGERLVRP